MEANGFTQRPKEPKVADHLADRYERVEAAAKAIVDCGFKIHSEIGPGLLESAYEAFLAAALRAEGLKVETQVHVPVNYRGTLIRDAFRVDIIVEGCVIAEVKSVERLAPVHHKQVMTYLRLTDLPLGLITNFGTEMFRDGIKRIINARSDYRAPSP